MTTTSTENVTRARFTRSLSEEDRQAAERSLGQLGHNMSRTSVMDFQRAQQIKVDGIIGPQTRGALQGAMAERDRSCVDPNFRREGGPVAPQEGDRSAPPGSQRAGDLRARDDLARNERQNGPQNGPLSPPGPGASERQRYDYYASVIRARGGQVNPNGQASVLGIRERDGVTHRFEDKIVVLSPNGRVNEFNASTRPSNTTWRNGGVAQLRPGNYDVVPHGPHYGRPSWEVTQNGSGNVPVMRDLNGDGQYSAREKATARTGNGILFHVPNPAYRDRTPTSIGCINIRNGDYDRFMSAVGGSRARFNFTLIDR